MEGEVLAVMEPDRSSDKRQRIIDAAMKLIAEKGYHGATTALIAKEAGVSQGIIFHYFKNKEDVFFSLLREKSTVFKEEFERNVGEEKDALKKIEIAIQTYCRLMTKEEHGLELMIKQARGSGLNIEKVNRYGMMETFKVIGDLLEQGIEQGAIGEIDAEVAATCLFGMLDFNAFRWMLYGKSFSIEEAGREVAEIFLHGIAKSSPSSRSAGT